MTTKLQKMKWDLHNYKLKQLLIWGLKNGYKPQCLHKRQIFITRT